MKLRRILLPHCQDLVSAAAGRGQARAGDVGRGRDEEDQLLWRGTLPHTRRWGDTITITSTSSIIYRCCVTGRYLGEMVRFCKEELDIESVTVVTNGSRTTEHWMAEYGYYLDIMAVSVDSFVPEVSSRYLHNVISFMYTVMSVCSRNCNYVFM